MCDNYDIIRKEICEYYDKHNPLFLDQLLYELDVERLLFRKIPYAGWSFYIFNDIIRNIDKKINTKLKYCQQRLKFMTLLYDKNNLLQDTDVIECISKQII